MNVVSVEKQCKYSLKGKWLVGNDGLGCVGRCPESNELDERNKRKM